MATLTKCLVMGDAIALSRLLGSTKKPPISSGIQPILHEAINAPTNCWLMVRLLLEAGVPINTPDLSGATALHIAADKMHAQCLQELLCWGAKVNQADKDGRIPLHYACRHRSKTAIRCVQILIQSGSTVNTPARYGYTPLHVAADTGNAIIVKMLLKAGAAHGQADDKGCTPLRLALTPAVAKELLNAGAEVRTRGNDNLTVLQNAIRYRPIIVENLLNAGISVRGETHDSSTRVFFHLNHIRDERTEVNILNDMAKYRHYDFLKHPLCETFLHLKWHRVQILFITKLLLFLTLISSLTVTSCLLIDWHANLPMPRNVLPSNDSVEVILLNNVHNMTESSDMDNTTTKDLKVLHNSTRNSIDNLKEGHRKSDGIMYLLVLSKVLLSVLLAMSVLQIIVLRTRFIRQLRKRMEILFLVGCLILLGMDKTGLTDWELHIWVFVLLTGWSEIVVLIGHMPSVGIYVHMFKQVSIRMLTFVAVYSSLFIGFAVSFHLVFKGEVFSTVWTSSLKTLAMMVGELDYASILGAEAKPSLFGTAQVIFILFVLLMTVVITNLLVGLAVQDIQMLQKEAGVSRLALTVEQETSVDILLSSRILQCIMPCKLLTWIQNKCSLLHHLPSRSLELPNVCNQERDSDACIDGWIRRGTKTQRRGPMEHYNVFICPYDPETPGKVYYSNATKLIPTNYTLPDWIVKNTKTLIENGLHTKEYDEELAADDSDEEMKEADTTNEKQNITLESLQEQILDLQKSISVMTQMLKKSSITK